MPISSLPQIPGYRVLAPLGMGGTSTIYCGEHGDTGLPVAIKVFDPQRTNIDGFEQRFAAEAWVMERINHPNVITVYDSGRLSDGRLYIIMELLEGQSLRAVMARHGPMAAGTLLPWVKQLCLGLAAVHQAGIVHRDFNPANVMVLPGDPLRLKLLDFGIAKVLEGGDGLTKPNVVLGTPLFMAPEQLNGHGQYGPATDIYSLGVVLYWLLAGEPPFCADTMAQLYAAHLMHAPPSLVERAPKTPPRVAELVHRCLAKEAQERPQSALAVAKGYAEAVFRQTPPPTLSGVGWAAYPELAATDPNAEFLGAPTRVTKPQGALVATQLDQPLEFVPFGLDEDVDELSDPSIDFDDAPTLMVDAGSSFDELPLTRVELFSLGDLLPSSTGVELHRSRTLIFDQQVPTAPRVHDGDDEQALALAGAPPNRWGRFLGLLPLLRLWRRGWRPWRWRLSS